MHLHSSDIAAIERAQRVLSSPLDYADRAVWARAACRAVRQVVDAPFGLYMHTVPGEASFCGDGAPAAVISAFRTNYHRAVSDSPAYDDELLMRSTAVRLQGGGRVYHERDLVPRELVVRSPFYQSVLRPHAFRHVAGMNVALDGGEVSLVLGFETDAAFGLSENGMMCLRLLKGSFESGIRTLRAVSRRPAAFGAAVDALHAPCLLIGSGGDVLHCSRALSESEEAPALTTHMQELGLRALSHPAADKPTPSVRVRLGEAGVPYQLWVSRLSEHVVGAPALLVCAERLNMPMPSPDELCRRLELTPREAEVALLMARGLTTRQVAERLDVSIHTARTHCERVLSKLDVPSRAAVALALLDRS